MTREVLTWRRERAAHWTLSGPISGTVGLVSPHVSAAGATGCFRGELAIATSPPQGWKVRGTVQAARLAVERMLADTWDADRFEIARKPQPLPPGTYTATVGKVSSRMVRGRVVITKILTLEDGRELTTRERY